MKIRVIYEKSKQTYGSPGGIHELIKLGVKVSRPRVAGLMMEAKIRSIVKRKFRVTTDSEHKYPYQVFVEEVEKIRAAGAVVILAGQAVLVMIL